MFLKNLNNKYFSKLIILGIIVLLLFPGITHAIALFSRQGFVVVTAKVVDGYYDDHMGNICKTDVDHSFVKISNVISYSPQYKVGGAYISNSKFKIGEILFIAGIMREGQPNIVCADRSGKITRRFESLGSPVIDPYLLINLLNYNTYILLLISLVLAILGFAKKSRFLKFLTLVILSAISFSLWVTIFLLLLSISVNKKELLSFGNKLKNKVLNKSNN